METIMVVRRGEALQIGECTVRLLKIKKLHAASNQVVRIAHFGFDAPKNVQIWRDELTNDRRRKHRGNDGHNKK